jgi:1,4-alpha-glucan branching enzyme
MSKHSDLVFVLLMINTQLNKCMNTRKFYDIDKWLNPYINIIEERISRYLQKENELTEGGSLVDFSLGHYYYGLHYVNNNWVLREWAPNATDIFIIGEFNHWKEEAGFRMKRVNEYGNWELLLSSDKLKHGDLFKLSVHWEGGKGERIPSYISRVVQDDKTKIFSAQVWHPPEQYEWETENFHCEDNAPVIYEAHIGMATPEERTGSFNEFTDNIIPRIVRAGYNTIQLMAIQEHPFYGSFGYHVSNYFAVSSRFGTPEELKRLIDTAHKSGLRVIMDIVQSHAVKNTNEGLGLFDGSPGQYFHTSNRRDHVAWDSLCFDYGKNSVIHFLLSNCHYWLEEYKFDGFRFDGITSMIYYDHGLGKNFTSYDDYFNGGQDMDALIYLYLANKMIHTLRPGALTIAEEMSGMPGLAAATDKGGIGFDYRLSMGVPDLWIKLIKEIPDENWDMGLLVHELTQHRPEEKIISYCESHDQALVGDKTLIFRMLDSEMYTGMSVSYHSFSMDRGIALHKMIRLLTFSTAGGGYLNFMGNEFGHPEWIDFPRQGNNWSYKYARRQWHLAENNDLKYQFLSVFDQQMVDLQNDFRVLDNMYIERLTENNDDKIIAFTRGDLLFVFNFHPLKSYTGYGIPVKGKYRIILDTDDSAFGGFDRIDRTVLYSAEKKSERPALNIPFYLFLYLPSRCALVLKKEAVRRATDL